MSLLSNLSVKIFADGADIKAMLEMYRNPLIKGFTTNPTLMRKAGITDYESFAREILSFIKNRPISFEVFSDDFVEMERQALKIASWGENVFVKIPVTNTQRLSSVQLIRNLSQSGVKLNITAMMTVQQVRAVAEALADTTPSCVSIFAGRIADTGRNPVETMVKALNILRNYPHIELLWASPRELWNIFEADRIGCHIITVTNDILKKLSLVEKNLDDFSLETVKMFYDDARSAGFHI